MRHLTVTFCLLFIAIVGWAVPSESKLDFGPVWSRAEELYRKTVQTTPKGQFVERTDSSTGKWITRGAGDWTAGFYPGVLWQIYKNNKDVWWKDSALRIQEPLAVNAKNTQTHDVGFIMMTSFGLGFELTGNQSFLPLLQKTSDSLATRFNPIVGCTRSWNGDGFQVIIDNMMNLDLFWKTSKNSPTHKNAKKWKSIAVSHATRTLQEHFRHPIWSSYHLVNYSPTNGVARNKGTVQGYAFNSTWARGQAWAVYGFAWSYQATKNEAFKNASEGLAKFYFDNLPSDFVPFWDFNDPSIPNTVRDTSAATPLASGLLLLASFQPNPTDNIYFKTAEKILDSLSKPPYLTTGTKLQSLLAHGSQNVPVGNKDTGICWGDYYFLEAIHRYNALVKA
eukprot:TRINITY_DN1526_c0_g1_i1.p1 TRINITY_DN1526_c0_g1~~TRINITY_DN1526_c0_g1_i1.p1  ORF type:complete len:393 (+),score=112.22 TRINITY_DN1526_c0_g1_i1:63-1241(+)